MKTTCCITDHQIEIFLPFIQYDVLEIIANFLVTGELISDTKEALEMAVNVLVEDLGFPSEIYVNNASNDLLGDDYDNLEIQGMVCLSSGRWETARLSFCELRYSTHLSGTRCGERCQLS